MNPAAAADIRAATQRNAASFIAPCTRAIVAAMFVRHALRWLLPLLAVASLALAPVTVPAAAARMHASVATHSMAGMDMARMPMSHADMAMDAAETAMPCCPHGPSDRPDCAQECPMMALCVAKVAAGMSAAIGLPVRVAVAQAASWAADAPFVSLAPAPLPEPPRS